MDDKRKYEKTDVPFVEVCAVLGGFGTKWTDLSQSIITRMERIQITTTHDGTRAVHPYAAILLTRGDVQMILEQDHVNVMVKLLTEQADG